MHWSSARVRPALLQALRASEGAPAAGAGLRCGDPGIGVWAVASPARIKWKASAPALFREISIRSVCDEILMVTDADAFAMVKNLAAREGVLSGSSGGANVFASLQVARRLGPGKRVVTMIPDSAERYLSKKIFEGGI